ncbi:hypothetical protein [Endozoicomonas sp. ALE010]|uniref:hypothetical protein n=1 Tax=Endozoicomonas sp. ALE010 TaxID=3403081 RepID=UPI003BB4E3A4
MKTFGKIESQFWDTMRHEELSDQGKLLAAYLLTCKHGNMIGIFSLPRAYIMGDLKWDAETVEITVSELLANRFLSVSAKTDFICINKFMAHNRAENVKQMEARLRLLLNLPESLSNDLPMFTNLVSGELLKASSFKGGSETRRLIEQVRSKFTKRSEPVSEPLANSEEKVRPENKRNREEENKRNIYKTCVRSDDRTTPRTGEVPSSAGSTTGATSRTEEVPPSVGSTTGATAAKAKSGKADFSESFEEWWSQYPKREGDKGSKTKTFGHYKTRLREGHSSDDLLANILNYARYCDETGATGTQYVKTTTTYLNNPDNASNPWMVNYEARQRNSGKLSLVEQVEQANAHILQPERTGAFSGTEAFSGGNIYDVEPERSGDSVFDHDGPVRPEVDQCLRSG